MMDLNEMFTDLRLPPRPFLSNRGKEDGEWSSWRQEAQRAAAVVLSLSPDCSYGALCAALELVQRRYLRWEHAYLKSRMA